MTAAVDCSQVGAGVLRDRPWWGGPKPLQAASVKSRGGERCGKGVYRPGVREVVAAAFGCFNRKAVVPGGAAGWQIAEPEGDPAGSGAGRARNAAAGTRWTAGQLGSGHRAVAPHRGRGALRRPARRRTTLRLRVDHPTPRPRSTGRRTDDAQIAPKAGDRARRISSMLYSSAAPE